LPAACSLFISQSTNVSSPPSRIEILKNRNPSKKFLTDFLEGEAAYSAFQIPLKQHSGILKTTTTHEERS
jgi:hypothetical protein